MKAIWNNQVIAQSDDTVVVEGNHYFPPDSIDKQFFEASGKTTFCPWKGTASYYTISVDGETADNAAWTYEEPKEKAAEIKDHIAFYSAVTVS